MIDKVNSQVKTSSHGRLFAIIQLAGKQRRVTDGDLVMVEGMYPPRVGDVIRAEKVLLVGSRDFTLLGRPLLRPDLVRVEATAVENSLSHTKTHFKKKRRKNYMRIHRESEIYVTKFSTTYSSHILLQTIGITTPSSASIASAWKV